MDVHLASVLDGNLDAYEHVVRQHQAEVWPIASMLLYSHEATEQLVADIFVRVYRQIDRYDPQYAFAAFVKTTARQVVRERLDATPTDARHAAYRTNLSKVMADDATAVKYHRQMQRLVDDCIDRLPDKSRELVALRFDQGLDLKTIGGRLNRPVASVRQALGRVRMTLAQCVRQAAAAGGGPNA